MSMRREQAAFVCGHVFEGSRPVLLVVREDGDWQLLCGGSHHAGEKPRVVGLEHLLERDHRVREVMDLNEGWEAERSGGAAQWHRRPFQEKEALESLPDE